MLAARGYRYVLQASRGTDGSGGSHSYFDEVPDGRNTADWIAEQSWFNGSLGTYGGSYMGYTQWALASTRPPYLKAMAIALCGSVRRFAWYPGGSYALEIIIPWDMGAVNFNKPQAAATLDTSPDAIAKRMETLQQGFDHLPLGDAIKFLSGEDLPLFTDQLAHGDPDDPFWASLDFSAMLATWDVPTLLVDGWQDYQCPQMLDDYVALRAGGTPVWIRIGAGGHIGGGGEGGMTEAPLLWFDTTCMGKTGLLPERTVTLEVLGEGGGWRDFEAWPPPATATPWFLHPGGGLSTDVPSGAHEPDRFHYDPADPTPSVGGIGMLTGGSQRQPRARGASRRSRVHERRARARVRDRRSGARRPPRVVESRPHRLLRARVRRVSRRPVDERVRRAAAVHAVDDRARVRTAASARRSRCGRRHTGSPPDTACASRYRVVHTRCTRATSGPASRCSPRRR